LAEGAIAVAADLARTLDAPVRLLRVVEYPAPLLADGAPYLATFDPFAEQDAALVYLNSVATGLRADGLAVEVESTVAPPGLVDQVATTIAEVARDRGAWAIALATHGRGGVARLVLGSVATGVIQRGSTLLLLVRPRGAGQAARTPIATSAASAFPITVTLTAAERELVQRGLTVLLHGALCRSDARGQPLLEGAEATAVQALLARLARTETAPAGDRRLGARGPP
jgi:nucleotide-binding universal stress UspA family protein